jgi:uroporphyrinogen decarboxylase
MKMEASVDKKTRVFNTLTKKPVDRPPFTFWQHMPPGAEGGQACIDAHVRLYRGADTDLVKMMIDGYRDVSGGTAIDRAADWENVNFPKTDSPFVTGQLERINRFIDAIHDEAPVFYHSFTPLSAMRITWGDKIVFSHLLDDDLRPFFLRALDELTRLFIEFGTLFLTQTAACGMMITVTGTENNGLSDSQFLSYIAPRDKTYIDALNKLSVYNMLHFCGFSNRPNRLHLWQDYEAAAATVDIFEDAVTLQDAPGFFPRIRAFMGGFDVAPGSLLMAGGEGEIKARTRALVKEIGEMPFIVGAANTAPREIAHDRFRWVGEALAMSNESPRPAG